MVTQIKPPAPSTQATPDPQSPPQGDFRGDCGLSLGSQTLPRRISLSPELLFPPPWLISAWKTLGGPWRRGGPWDRLCLAALSASIVLAGLEVLVLFRDVITLSLHLRHDEELWGVLLVVGSGILAILAARRGPWAAGWLMVWFFTLSAAPTFPGLGAVVGMMVILGGALMGAFEDDAAPAAAENSAIAIENDQGESRHGSE